MAGDWIKMRSNLWDDPRVTRLCDLTEQNEATIIGGLYWLWATADQHTEDGHMPGLSVAGIDRKTGVKGFGAALLEIGWISDTPGGVTIARFDEHNGSSAKRRCMEAQRKANSRKLSASDADTSRTEGGQNPPNCGAREREEKEKSKHPPIPPKTGGDVSAKKGKSAVAFKTFLADCKAAGEQPIPDGDPVLAYAAQAGIPDEFLELHWREFVDRYKLPDAKRYKNWRSVFRKSVRGNWFKLWYVDTAGQYMLTTVGIQAKNTHGGKAA